MSKSTRLALALVGLALAAFGLILGFTPIKADGYSCGSAFRESSDLRVDQLVDTFRGGTGANGCDDARSGRQPFAWGLLAIGGILVLGCLTIPAADERESSGKSGAPGGVA